MENTTPKTVTLQNLKFFSDEDLQAGIENPGSLIIAGLDGFFRLIYKIVQLIAVAGAKHRTRTDELEENQVKIEAAIAAIQKELGTDEAQLFKLSKPSAAASVAAAGDTAMQDAGKKEYPAIEKAPGAEEEKTQAPVLDDEKQDQIKARIAELDKEKADLEAQLSSPVQGPAEEKAQGPAKGEGGAAAGPADAKKK